MQVIEAEFGVRFVHTPRWPLSDYVMAVWSVKGPPDTSAWKVLPNGVVELIVNLAAARQSVVDADDPKRVTWYRDAWLAGMQDHFIVIAAEAETDLLGIRFKPGGVTPFLRHSPSVVTNYVVECQEIFGDLVIALKDRLLGTSRADEQVRLVEQLLLDRIDVDWTFDPLVREALRRLSPAAGPAPTIERLAADLAISPAQLTRRVRDETGLTAKRLSEIFRFQNVLGAVAGMDSADWTEVALRFGYYDQSHLIHEFQRFAGASPTEYLRNRNELEANHIRVA
jgi:AraC-like DNA-binding protein